MVNRNRTGRPVVAGLICTAVLMALAILAGLAGLAACGTSSAGAAVVPVNRYLAQAPGRVEVSPPIHQWSGVPAASTPAGDSAVISANWSGFISDVGNGTAVSVQGSWVVPSASASATTSRTGYSSTWVGIGGFVRNSDEGVVQCGTNQLVVDGQASYSAWYESTTSTASAITLAEPVAPGNVMTATVNEVATGTWNLTIHDATLGWSTSVPVSYDGTTDSAEWIEERPEIGTSEANAALAPLADFGSVSFTSMAVNGTDAGGFTKTPTFIEKSPNTPVIAYPWSSAPGLTAPATVTYGTPEPTVQSVSPNHGVAGATVVVTGTWLIDVTGVHFQYATAGSFSNGGTQPTVAVNGATELTVVVPPNTIGSTANVVVITLDGTTSLSPGDTFTYGTPPPSGYDLVGADGGVFVFSPPGSSSGFYGSLPSIGVTPDAPVVGMVPTTTDNGYFLVGSDGGVFSFGTAPFLGSLPGLGVKPSAPITAIVAADTDKGYFLVGRDGGVFAFGTVTYLGSLPGSGVTVDNIIGIAATPTGNGYWLVSATGSVYAYGSAQRLGTSSVSPVAAIAGTPTGGGYWIASTLGAVQAFGKSTDYATLPLAGVVPSSPVIGIVPTTGTGGYWLIGSDGGIFAFGDAGFVGSLPGDGVHVDDIVGAVPIA